MICSCVSITLFDLKPLLGSSGVIIRRRRVVRLRIPLARHRDAALHAPFDEMVNIQVGEELQPYAGVFQHDMPVQPGPATSFSSIYVGLQVKVVVVPKRLAPEVGPDVLRSRGRTLRQLSLFPPASSRTLL